MARTAIHGQDCHTWPGLPYMARTAIYGQDCRIGAGLLYTCMARTAVNRRDSYTAAYGH